MLGKNAVIKSTDEIKIQSGKIRSAFGDYKYAPAFKGNFPLKINKKKVSTYVTNLQSYCKVCQNILQ